MHRPRSARRALAGLAATLLVLAPACSSDSGDSGDALGSDDEVTIVTTITGCDQVLDEVAQRLEGFDTEVDTADLQSIEAEVNAGTDALIAADCDDSTFGDLSEARCEFLDTLEASDPQSTAVLTGFQEACTDE